MAKSREEKLESAIKLRDQKIARVAKLMDKEAPAEEQKLIAAKVMVEEDKIEKLNERIKKLSAPVLSPEARKEIRILQNAVEILRKYTAPVDTTNHLLVLISEIQKAESA